MLAFYRGTDVETIAHRTESRNDADVTSKEFGAACASFGHDVTTSAVS